MPRQNHTQFSNVRECLGTEDLNTLNRYRVDTIERGYPEHYGELAPFDGRTQSVPDARDSWYVPSSCCGSDYLGCLVNRANCDAMMEIAKAAIEAGELDADTVVEVYGGHGTYAVAIRGDVSNVEIIEALCALADYPVLDEDRWSELEMDAQQMAWDNGGFGLRRDFARALEKRVKSDDVDVKSDDVDVEDPGIDLAAPHVRDAVDALFEAARERCGEEWRNEQGCDMWIDVDRVADEVTDEEIAWYGLAL